MRPPPTRGRTIALPRREGGPILPRRGGGYLTWEGAVRAARRGGGCSAAAMRRPSLCRMRSRVRNPRKCTCRPSGFPAPGGLPLRDQGRKLRRFILQATLAISSCMQELCSAAESRKKLCYYLRDSESRKSRKNAIQLEKNLPKIIAATTMILAYCCRFLWSWSWKKVLPCTSTTTVDG